ncbi:doublecortin domain-containing protein 2C [Tamandua tetradactyla]|uniref:doublecortin domain-containing protein 2C n=1 Tax=Tamandua tetradactyla TaxID=48850 RepID=UPI0040544397
MGTHAPYTLIDTTPAKTILVYRNGDQYYVGKKFVCNRRRMASFEVFLDQLNEEMEVPFGVRRLYTPTSGHQVQELGGLQQGGRYVAAGREGFKKLDYFHIVPRKPGKMRKYKEIKPVIHCEMNVPSRWHTFQHTSRYINSSTMNMLESRCITVLGRHFSTSVFTNGRLFIPPVKIIIPKFTLSDWSSVLAVIGEKVFPLGGVRKLFTMNGHLLDDTKDLLDNHFYVAAGLETFKYFPYWKSSKVPSEIQQKYADMEKYSRKKKKENVKGKEPRINEGAPLQTQDSVYYAKGRKKVPMREPLITRGAEGDVYKARTPNTETQGAPDVKEDQDIQVEVPIDQISAEVIKEDGEIYDTPNFEDYKVLALRPQSFIICPVLQLIWIPFPASTRLDNPCISPSPLFVVILSSIPSPDQWLSHLASSTAPAPLSRTQHQGGSFMTVHKNLSQDKKMVPFTEKEPSDILEEKETPVKRKSSFGEQERSPLGQQEQISEAQESPEQSPVAQPSQEEISETQEPLEQSPLGQQEQIPETQESPEQSPLGQPPQEQIPEAQGSPAKSPVGQPSQEKNT